MGLLHGADAMSDGPFVRGLPSAEECARSERAIAEAIQTCEAERDSLNEKEQYVSINGFCFPYHFDAEVHRMSDIVHKKDECEFFYVETGEFGDYCVAWRKKGSSCAWTGVKRSLEIPCFK